MIDRGSLSSIVPSLVYVSSGNINFNHTIFEEKVAQNRLFHEQQILQKLSAFNSEKINLKSYWHMNNKGIPKLDQVNLPEGDGTIVFVQAN